MFYGGLPREKDAKDFSSQAGITSAVLLCRRCFEVSPFMVSVEIHSPTLVASSSVSNFLHPSSCTSDVTGDLLAFEDFRDLVASLAVSHPHHR